MIEYDHAAGNGFCVSCGTVIEENTIVNELGFDETSAGAAVVQGSFVAQGSSMSFTSTRGAYSLICIYSTGASNWPSRSSSKSRVEGTNHRERYGTQAAYTLRFILI